jgi:dolichol-phosphate mannosyltransferase
MSIALSVLIPAHNEEGCIEGTVRALSSRLRSEEISHEILVVNDSSTDGTEALLERLKAELPEFRYVNNPKPSGFGFAIRKGFESYVGRVVAVYMADASDRPEDLVRFYRECETGRVDCVFGTRFSPDSTVVDYPLPKLLLNRMANFFICLLFGHRYNDTTNAFKLYRREVIDGLKPLLSCHFNLTVELPLKAIIRGYSYTVVPNDWINRKSGESKLKIKEMGSRYLFIILYCLLEKWLSRGDYAIKPNAYPERQRT